MFNDLLGATDLAVWPVTGLLLFFTTMAGVYLWAYAPKRRAMFERLGAAALNDGHSPDSGGQS